MRSINAHADGMEVTDIYTAAIAARSELISHLSRRLEDLNNAISQHEDKGKVGYLHMPRLVVQRVRIMTLVEYLADTGSSHSEYLDPAKIGTMLSLIDDRAPASDDVEESYLRNRLLFVLLQLQEQIENRCPAQTA
jgi:hypothetical protein